MQLQLRIASKPVLASVAVGVQFEMDWAESLRVFRETLDHQGLRVYPINLRGYAKLRPSSSLFRQDMDVTGLVVISDRRFFEACVVDEFAATGDAQNIVDRALKGAIKAALPLLPTFRKVHFLDRLPLGNELIDAQTLGQLAGFAENISPADVYGAAGPPDALIQKLVDSRDPVFWQSARPGFMLGLSVHEELGGWFAYRCLVDLGVPVGLVGRQTERRFLGDKWRQKLLESFNLLPDCGLWRDAPLAADCKDKIAAETRRRYGPLQFVFFANTEAEERQRVLELCVWKREKDRGLFLKV